MRAPKARRYRVEALVVFGVSLSAYVVIATLLDFKYHVYPADAMSRMANGFYIIYSNDPHLAAVGFVWEPLQSVADMVVLLGNHLWPALSRNDMAGSLVSSVSMAGATYQIWAALREWGVSRTPRLVLTAFFAFNPMILYYGGNGMSEALFLFTMVMSTRYLLRWMHDGDLRSLAYSAVALAFCYLTRNEAATAALAGGLVVGVVTYWRTQGRRALRMKTGLSDLMIFGVPAFLAVAGWAICSYVIIGQLLDGGALATRLAHQRLQSHTTLSWRVTYEVHAFMALAPALVILLALAGVVAVKRKDPRILAVVAVIGGSLGFDTLSFLGNAIDNEFRYWIAVVPLGILVLGSLLAAIQTPPPAPLTKPALPVQPRSTRAAALASFAALCLVLLVMIPTTVTSWSGLMNPKVGVQESEQIGYLFKPHVNTTKLKEDSVYSFALGMSSYLDGRHFPNGDVLVDNSDASGCVPQTIVTSSDPKMFVIPNDRDFQRVLNDPISFHTHYVLVPDSSTLEPGAINLLYPSLWKSGAGFTKMVHQFTARAGSACPDFRLFRVTGHSNQVT